MDTHDDLIASLYDAAIGTIPWPRVLDSIARQLNCVVVQILGVDLEQQAMIYSFEGGQGVSRPVEVALNYTCKYHRIDPHLQHVMTQAVGTLTCFHEIISEKAAQHHPFYQEFLLPFGMRYVHGGKVFQNDTTAVVMGLHRGPNTGPLQSEELIQAQCLFFHAGRAASIYSRLVPQHAEAAVGRETLNRLNSPVILMDEQRRIRSSNAAADRILTRGDIVASHHGHFWCRHEPSNEVITVAIRNLNLPGSAWRYVDTVDRAVVRLPLPAHVLPMTVCLMALRPESTLGAFGRQALAMVLLHDPRERRQLDPLMLTTAFGLTPAEARVAASLAEGRLPKQIAQTCGTSVHTVRTQMQSLYHKLGVSHVSDLVATLHSSPLAAFTHGSDEASGNPHLKRLTR